MTGCEKAQLKKVLSYTGLLLTLLTGTAGTSFATVGCSKGSVPEPTPIPEPMPEPTPKTTYELALEKLDPATAEHWKGVSRDYNSEQAIDELYFLPEEGRLVLTDDIKEYAANGTIDIKEYADIADPDRDGIKSGEEYKNNTNPMDPSNSTDKIEPKTFNFVRNLIKYNDSQVDDRTLSVLYPNLGNVINVIERQSKIANGLDLYGSDFLAQFLHDKDNQEILQYWRGVNALGLQAQKYFYDAPTNIKNLKGAFKDKKYGLNEEELIDNIWKIRIAYQNKGEVLIPMDDSISDLWGDEQVQINNLRQSLMPQAIFFMDIKNGKTHQLFDWYNTDNDIKIALYNVSQFRGIHYEIWGIINNKSESDKQIELLIKSCELNGAGTGNLNSGIKYVEYLRAMVEYDRLIDISPVLRQYARPVGHENFVELSALYAWSIGGAGYRSEGTNSDGTTDGEPAFPISDSMKAKISSLGDPVIDTNTNSLPVLYCDLSAASRDEIKFIKILQPDNWTYLYGSE